MKLNRWFNREILERFMSADDLEQLQEDYNAAKILEVGYEELKEREKV